MTATAAVFLAFAAVAAVADWWAVWRGVAALEYAAKPVATAAFLGAAASLDVADAGPRAWLVAALLLCLAGDVFLMLPRNAFLPGLASFAAAQVLLAASFIAAGTDASRVVIGGAVVVGAAVPLAARFVRALRRSGKRDLVGAVIVYLGVICTMTVAAFGEGSPVAVAGAVSFMVSDSLIAESRFVRPRRWQSVAIMVTYHAALAGLVLGRI